MAISEEARAQLAQKIAKILDETRTSNATHIRKLKELSALREKFRASEFFSDVFFKTLTPLFAFQRRAASTERVVRFVSAYACGSDADFLEGFLKFLLIASASANKAARFRACQIISEIIMRLPDDAEVSSNIWDEVIECMKQRVGDKVSAIRTFAVRALSRFAGDFESKDILELFLETLDTEQNAEVRKTIVLSLPPSNETSQAIINHTLDVSESVRKAAYCTLGSKFPLQSLSIKHRTLIIKRGLADRSASVSNECLKLLKDDWLVRGCKGDPIVLLKYLDVETYESVGESVMEALLTAGLVKLHGCGSIQQYVQLARHETGDYENPGTGIQLMEAEIAFFWRAVCRHLQAQADAKGSDAAATMGAEAAVYAAEASDKNDLLEKILPATVTDYIDLVKAHISGGPNYHFASRQLLLLGSMLDFSDATNRKVASAFLQELLHRPLEHELDDEGNKVIIGDGINLGGERDWACAVSQLARKVHAASGEFEEVMLGVIEELAQPCRDRTADFMQWMHCLAVTGLLLENAKSLYSLHGRSIEPTELLQSLLLPGAKHVSLDAQRVAVRCIGLYGLLETKPSEEVIRQLRISFVRSPAPISIVACKALIDLAMWHGPEEVDRALGLDLSSQLQEDKTAFNPMDFSNEDGDLNTELLDLLYAAIDENDLPSALDSEENESVQGVLGEGFAKILLLSDKYPGIPASLHPLLLAKLVNLYFNSDSKELHRLKQCLSVFFDHYPSLSVNHKKCLSKAFIPVVSSMWPGINGNPGGPSFMVSKMRKLGVQASRFMLQMMQAPLYAKETKLEDEAGTTELTDTSETSSVPFEFGEEGLAIRTATEVAGLQSKKTPAEKSYASALCKILVLCRFRSSEQGAIKLMRRLLVRAAESASFEKDLVKELKQMADRLKAQDQSPDQELSQDELNGILGRLELGCNLDISSDSVSLSETPAPRPPRQTRARRRVKREEGSSDEDDEDIAPTSVVPAAVGTGGTRTQRASKTAALTKIAAKNSTKIEEEDEDDDDEDSEVTSDDSDETDQCSE